MTLIVRKWRRHDCHSRVVGKRPPGLRAAVFDPGWIARWHRAALLDQWTMYRSEHLWHGGRYGTYSDRSQNRPPDVPQYLDKCWGGYTMMDRRLKARSASINWAISAADPLHIDRSTTRIIKSGSKDSIRCIGGLISCWEDTHPLRSS